MPTGTNPRANAIRRAHVAGQREMAIYLRQLQQTIADIYRRAGEILQAEIIRAGNAEGIIGIDQLGNLRRTVDDTLDQVRSATENQLDQSLNRMVELGINPFQSEDIGTPVAQLTEQVLRNLRAFTDSNGLQLSDRLWRVDTALRRAVQESIETAVAEGQSASQATRDFLTRGEVIPPDIISKRERAAAQAIAVQNLNRMDGGKEYRKVLQVMQTESIRAHGMAHRAAATAHPDVVGVRFTLSPRHPEVDICDVHASANIYGLGAGVYPPDRSPWPAHPNTFSFEQVVFRDEVTDEDRAGKQTRVDWLNAQPDNIALPALGGTEAKLKAFRAGHVGERSIATPWRALRERLARQGIDVGRFE